MSERLPVDYDAEAVFLDGIWMTREDLAARIRAHLDRGEYRISRLSAALEWLEVELSRARVLAVRVPAELAQAVEEEASRRGCSSASVLREAIRAFLHQQVVNGDGAVEGVDERWFEG
ncbi:MAG TPA: ribbon-helix-helix protein, CopG family [Fredinandcohnia sp.]|nr:ribbon-helix-helix protein, CopG family [Fredinandcohnia sp.]